MRTVRLFVAGLFAMLIGSIAWAAACDGFTDVDSANSTYCPAVTYLKDRGITLGCTGTTYCPNDPVTRLQMALFLQRLGKGGPHSTLGDSTDTVGGGDYHVTVDLSEFGGAYATVAGGVSNSATYYHATVAGGEGNIASGLESSVGGGSENTASVQYTSIGGGKGNVASGNASTVPGGYFNTASGIGSFAAGTLATADQDGCAVFSLWSVNAGISCLNTPNVFRIGGDHGLSIDYSVRRSDGGGTRYVGIGDLTSGQTITAWNGAFLSDAGVWTSVSDRAAKNHFTPISSEDVLNRVVGLPIERWQYKAEPEATHIGPVAQDFYAAFGVGSDDKHISMIDEGGVALAAIQGLNAKLEADQMLIAEQAHELAEIKAQLAAMAAAH